MAVMRGRTPLHARRLHLAPEQQHPAVYRLRNRTQRNPTIMNQTEQSLHNWITDRRARERTRNQPALTIHQAHANAKRIMHAAQKEADKARREAKQRLSDATHFAVTIQRRRAILAQADLKHRAMKQERQRSRQAQPERCGVCGDWTLNHHCNTCQRKKRP